MAFKTKIKKTWEIAKKVYLAAFLATTMHVCYDFFINNLPRIERGDVPQYMQVHKYKVNICGKEKKLTLVGECHSYNEKEYIIGRDLINEHSNFASECGETIPASLIDYPYLLALTVPVNSVSGFSDLANGRWYRSISREAIEQGHKVHALEIDSLAFVSLKDKALIFGDAIFSMFASPYFYYKRKNEEPYDPKYFDDFPWKESMIDKRDEVMSNNIANLLYQKKIDNLLVNFGAGHLEGITNHLCAEMELIEIQ